MTKKTRNILFLFCLFSSSISSSLLGNNSTYRFSSDFSAKQGQNQWYYKYWDGLKYHDMKWDPEENCWKGPEECLFIDRKGAQAGTSIAVIAWQAPKEGTIAVMGNMIFSNLEGDGVKAKVMKNDAQVWPSEGWQQLIPGQTARHVFTTEVKSKDFIYFYSSLESKGSLKTISWSARKGFATQQGKNQWYYQEYNEEDGSYKDMIYDEANKRWQGGEHYMLVGDKWQHPQGKNWSVRKWICPAGFRNHLFIIKGTARHDQTQGDGVKVRILKNNTKIWGPHTLKSSIKQHNLKVRLSQGDSISFQVHELDSSEYDTTSWEPIIKTETVAKSKPTKKNKLRWGPEISYEKSPRFVLDKQEIIMTQEDIEKSGTWIIDNPLGCVSKGSKVEWYWQHRLGGDGLIGKTRGPLNNPVETVVYKNREYENPHNLPGDWWTQNIYQINKRELLGFTHIENVDGRKFMGGLVYSPNDGRTWEKLGIIIKQYMEPQNVNIAGMPFLIKDGYFHVYYFDNGWGKSAVVREKVGDVIKAAREGKVTEWKKYYNGSWDESGLGGKASDLGYQIGHHNDGAYVKPIKHYVMAAMGQLNPVRLVWSKDAIIWISDDIIAPELPNKNGIMAYTVIIDSDGSDNSVVDQNSFYVYWVLNNEDWGNATTAPTIPMFYMRVKVILNLEKW